jgi:hypothetical protein
VWPIHPAALAHLDVNPEAASQLVVEGFPSSISAGTPGNFTVTAEDASCNVATGYTLRDKGPGGVANNGKPLSEPPVLGIVTERSTAVRGPRCLIPRSWR